LGYNMFAYCFNNPVNMSDSSGNWPKFMKEVGARLKHTVNIMTKIITSPLKAITAEIGMGIGFGANAEANIEGIPVEGGASYTITDSIIYNKGTFDVINTTSTDLGLRMGELDAATSTGKQHSYFDEQCTCSFWNSTFGEKSECKANRNFVSSDATIGSQLSASASIYFILGAEASISFDFKAWGEELIAIYKESLTFKGYY